MKTHYLISFGILYALAAFVPFIAQASTIQFQTNTVNVQPGDTFTVRITMVPDAPAQYTARFILQFPPQLLAVSSFSLDSRWIPLPQKGYDLIDNTGGQIIKTAGFPGGFKSPTTFGTITFKAKAAGTGLLTVGSNSFVLNAQNKSTLSARPQIALRVGNTTGVLAVPVSLPAGQPNLFDVRLGIAPARQGFNWIPWAVVIVICLLAAYVVWIHRRRH